MGQTLKLSHPVMSKCPPKSKSKKWVWVCQNLPVCYIMDWYGHCWSVPTLEHLPLSFAWVASPSILSPRNVTTIWCFQVAPAFQNNGSPWLVTIPWLQGALAVHWNLDRLPSHLSWRGTWVNWQPGTGAITLVIQFGNHQLGHPQSHCSWKAKTTSFVRASTPATLGPLWLLA